MEGAEMKHLFPIWGWWRTGEYEINWHEVAELLRNKKFDQIPSYGWYVIADKLDPEPTKKGRRKRKLELVIAVSSRFSTLRKDGILYEKALDVVADEFNLSVKAIESILQEQKKILMEHTNAIVAAHKKWSEHPKGCDCLKCKPPMT